MNETIWICSFDIGVKNLAFYIEEYNPEKLKKLVNIPKKDRYSPDGKKKKEYRKLINDLYCTGKVVFFTKLDVTGETDPKKYIDHKIFLNTVKILDKYNYLFDKCSAFIIEQQMSFTGFSGKGRKVSKFNTRAIKMGQHIYSYFLMTYLDTKLIYEFPSYHKTKVLGDAVKMKDKERKAWSTEEATRLLLLRDEEYFINTMDDFKKTDDIPDCILQAQAWKFLIYVERAKLAC